MCEFSQAVALHQQGRLEDAERIYQKYDTRFDALYLRGIIALQTGRIDLAIELFGETIALKPDHAEAYGNRGAALAHQRRFPAALADYNRAIALTPDNATVHINRGAAQSALGHDEEALASYATAIALRPDSADAYNNHAATLAVLGRPEAALASCDAAIALRPDHPSAHYNRANALRDLNRFDDALSSYDAAIARQPNHSAVYNNRGGVLASLGRPEEALTNYATAIALRPTSAEAHNNQGAALVDLGRLEESVSSYDKAIALKPDYAAAYKNRGAALAGLGRLDEALVSCDQAIALRPDYAEAYADRAAALTALGRIEDALVDCDTAVVLKPDTAEARFNRGACHLALGDFERGWEGFEWRWKSRFGPSQPGLPGLPWLGETPIDHKTILVYAEQGLGDSLQFCRYVPLLAERARVILDVPRSLRRLLSGLGGATVLTDEPPPPFDAWIPMMSLPLAFRTTLATIPASIPYLRADPAEAAAWKHRLAGLPGRKIGLVWAGSPFSQQPRAQAMDRRRSITLRHYAPLAAIPGVSLISLQKGDASAQPRPAGMLLHDWTDELTDYADTAALIEALDLVISVDTSVVHLAGALGKPIWVLNRYDQCWRWLRGRTDSPWYPSARLFRQRFPGDWSGVISEVTQALRSEPQSSPR
jgi:tetratricopeptide (TPR) repeat protein